MKYFAILFLVLSTSIYPNKKTNTKPPTIVLQLFTSQGCSSCPSADVLLEYIKKDFPNDNVIILSYHVDYWNYIGWKDPYSKKEYSNLQREYGRQLNLDRIYTPQLVINGKEHYVGSDKNKIYNNIYKSLKATSENALTFTKPTRKENTLKFNYTIDGNVKDKKLQLALVLDNKTTHVKRGENQNRTLINNNIVIQTSSLELQNATGSLSLEIPKEYQNEKGLTIIGFIEDDQLQIHGGNQIQL